MKPKIIFPLLIAGLCSATHAFAQSYYWVHGQKVAITRDSSRYVVESKNAFSKEAANQLLPNKEGKVQVANQPNRLLVSVDNPARTTRTAVRLRLAELPIVATYYALKLPNGQTVTPTGDIVFQPKKGVTYAQIIQKTNVKVTLLSQTDYNTFLVHPTNPAQLLSIANQIYESGLVDWSQPDFYSPFHFLQDDPFYPQQYYLNNTGQTGGTTDIDINAPEAWCYTKGSSSIRVAVIDEGMEAHEDLPNLVAGYDPRYSNSTGSPRGTVNGHGVACAGIIGAAHNRLGVAGIAPNVQLIPVNIADTGDAFYSDSEIASAINWAWNQGRADVLSNSWGGGSYSDPIATAINNARSQGRAGRGCIVVFAAGNARPFQGVFFPANLSGVITVGAIDRSGNIWDYSSRGPEMDFVAPSGDLNLAGDVFTTDRTGGNGYASGNYTGSFGGTSAACPQVAATAALVLSAVPGLTVSQVSSILINTATDMGPANFDNTFGYGRVNAAAAVANALQYNWGIVGPEALCNNSATYTVTNRLPSSTVTWSSSNPSIASIDASTGVANAIGSGSVTFTATSTTCTTTQYAIANVSINAGPAYPVITMGTSGCTNTIQCRIENFDGSLSYTVNRVSGITPIPAHPTSNTFIVKISGSNGTGTFSVTAASNCGPTTTDPIDAVFQCDEPSARVASTTMAYPNPANESVTIPEGVESATLLNGSGKPVQKIGNAGELNVQNLPDGLYNLQMIRSGKLINQRIQVKH